MKGQNFEENRLIRYLIPPFLFLLSLFLAMLFDPHHYRNLLDPVLQWMRSPQETTKVVVALIQFLAVGAFAVVAFGFLISSVSMCFLRWRNPDYEEKVSPSALESIRDRVRIDLGKNLAFYHEPTTEDRRYPVAVYTNWQLREKIPHIHAWIFRRWNMFLVSTHSSFALILALLIVFLWHVPDFDRSQPIDIPFVLWASATVLFVLFLVFNAHNALLDTREMVNFLVTGDSGESERWSQRSQWWVPLIGTLVVLAIFIATTRWCG